MHHLFSQSGLYTHKKQAGFRMTVSRRFVFLRLAGCTHLPACPGSLPRRLCKAGTPPGEGSTSRAQDPSCSVLVSEVVPRQKFRSVRSGSTPESPELVLSAAMHPERSFDGVFDEFNRANSPIQDNNKWWFLSKCSRHSLSSLFPRVIILFRGYNLQKAHVSARIRSLTVWSTNGKRHAGIQQTR